MGDADSKRELLRKVLEELEHDELSDSDLTGLPEVQPGPNAVLPDSDPYGQEFPDVSSDEELDETDALAKSAGAGAEQSSKRTRVGDPKVSPSGRALKREVVHVPTQYIPLLLKCFSHPPSILQSNIPDENNDLAVLNFLTDFSGGRRTSPSLKAWVSIRTEDREKQSKFSLIPFQNVDYDFRHFDPHNTVVLQSPYLNANLRSAIESSVQSYLIHLNFSETMDLIDVLNLPAESSGNILVFSRINAQGEPEYFDVKEFGKLKDVFEFDIFLKDYSDTVVKWFEDDTSFSNNSVKNEVGTTTVFMYNNFKNDDFTVFKTSNLFKKFLAMIQWFAHNYPKGDKWTEDEREHIMRTIDLYHKVAGKATLLSIQALNQLLLQEAGSKKEVEHVFGIYASRKAYNLLNLEEGGDMYTITDTVRNFVDNSNFGRPRS